MSEGQQILQRRYLQTRDGTYAPLSNKPPAFVTAGAEGDKVPSALQRRFCVPSQST